MMSLVGTLVHATPLAEAEEKTSGKQTIQILKSTVLQSLAFFFFSIPGDNVKQFYY